jgi:hypothetical protein
MQKEQHISLPPDGEPLQSGYYYQLPHDINGLTLAQRLVHSLKVNPIDAIGFSGNIDKSVPHASLLLQALNPYINVEYCTGIDSPHDNHNVPCAFLVFLGTERDERMKKILAQNEWATYASLFGGAEQFGRIVAPDHIRVNDDKRTFVWESHGLEVCLHLWEQWHVTAGETTRALAFHEMELLSSTLLPQQQQYDDRFCGALVAIKVAQAQGMDDVSQPSYSNNFEIRIVQAL